MALVKPFRGWRYNPAKISALEDVIVPPYDVISDQELIKLKHLSPYNFSKIILSDGSQKYDKAASLFKSWRNEKVFIQDPKPCLYFYEQTFKLDHYELFCQATGLSVNLKRTGIFATVGVEDYEKKIIFPHEHTFSGPKTDRYDLMDAVGGNSEPVFLGYDSPRFSGDEFNKIVANIKPECHYKDGAGVEHQLWAIDDISIHAEVESILMQKPFFILDGHHRYETALKYSKDKQSLASHEFLLAQICSFRQPGTVILPTHRLVRGMKNFNIAEIMDVWKDQFDWTWVESLSELEVLMKGSPNACFGVLASGSTRFGLLKLHSASTMKDKLDLEVLHELALNELQNSIIDENPKGLEISYEKSVPVVQAQIRKDDYQLGFLIRPSTIKDVMSTAQSGRKMPHKSTFFFPKIPSGLIVHLFE